MFRGSHLLMITSALAVTLAVGGCNNPDTLAIDEALVATRVEQIDNLRTNKVDVLLVVSESPSMTDEEERLRDALDSLLDALVDVQADFQIGVLTPQSLSRDGTGAAPLNSRPGAAYIPGVDPVLDESSQPVTCSSCQGECLEIEGVEPGLAFCAYDEEDAQGYCYTRRQTCTSPPEEIAEVCDGLDTSSNFLRGSDYVDIADPDAGIDVDRLVEEFRCLSYLGTCNAGAAPRPTERAFDSIERALAPEFIGSSGNDAFLRSDAQLIVVFVSDGDDCSVGLDVAEKRTPQDCWGAGDDEGLRGVDDFYNFITTELKESPDAVYAAAVVGRARRGYTWSPTEVGCTTPVDGLFDDVDLCEPDTTIDPPSSQDPCRYSPLTLGDVASCAIPGDRYTRLISQFGSRGVLGSICSISYDDVFNRLANTVSQNIGFSCVQEEPAACVRDTDCASGECLEAPAPLSIFTITDGAGGADAIECSTDDECATAANSAGACDDETCDASELVCDRGFCYLPTFPIGSTARRFCSDFEVEVTVQRNGTGDYEGLVGPGSVGDISYPEDRQFDVNYYAFQQCPESGIAYRVFEATGSDDRVRVIYPISIQGQTE